MDVWSKSLLHLKRVFTPLTFFQVTYQQQSAKQNIFETNSMPGPLIIKNLIPLVEG